MAFSNFENSTIKTFFDSIDESIITDISKFQKNSPFFKEISSNKDKLKVSRVIINFLVNRNDPKFIFSAINESKLEEDKKNLLTNCFTDLKNKISEEKVDEFRFKEILKDAGHPHLHGFTYFTEFRPISKVDGKITKLVPSIIVTGTMHDAESDNEVQINFQTSLSDLENLMKEMQSTITIMTNEINFFKKVMGDDIID